MAAADSLDTNTSLVTTASASQATESDTVSITAIIHNPQVRIFGKLNDNMKISKTVFYLFLKQ